jgi:hypothetical protein
MSIFSNISGAEIWRISVDVLVLAALLRLLRNGLALSHCEVVGGRLGRTGSWLGPALAREARGDDGEDSWSQLGKVSFSFAGFGGAERSRLLASNLKRPWSVA